MKKKYCRFCGKEIKHNFINLGLSPLSNSYIRKEDYGCSQRFFPLNVGVCENCFLVQTTGEYDTPEEIFSDYSYFSSFSSSWLKHAKDYVEFVSTKFNLSSDSFVVEIASNDGYLLQYFKEKNIPLLGIEPAHNIASIAVNEKGIPTLSEFFTSELAQKLANKNEKADLIIGNNVLAHVPNINDFVEGIRILLKDTGFVTMEFPHLLQLIKNNQFDTIYHEHFSYLSLIAVKRIFEAHHLKIFDVQELSTHGGSLRIFACKENCQNYSINGAVCKVLEDESKCRLNSIDGYLSFDDCAKKVKRDLLSKLISIKNQGKTIIGYGAAAKGNTLLNYCGIRQDFLDYVVDKSPYKQNTYLPGSYIPVFSPQKIKVTKPDYILILPWNLRTEISNELSYVKEWNCKFIVAIPKVEIF